MSEADAVVVGAGPAGSIAALVLARAGLRVRLLDRARFPRFKLCGDTLNPGALAILRDLDEPTWQRVLRRSLPIAGMTVTGPGGACVTANYPAGVRGVAIARSDLDLLLLEAAIAAGAQFEDGVKVVAPVVVEDGPVTGVRIAAAGGEHALAARVVIAADGRGSRLGGAVGLSRFAASPRRWAFGAHYTGVAGLTARGEMHIRGDGYLGIAPLPGGAANVCVVRERSSLGGSPANRGAAAAAERPLEARTIIDEAVAADASLRARFAGAGRCTAVTTLGPLALEADAAGVPGLLLAGDAAGFVDPMTGDGLRFAIRGGVLAAEAALRELAGAPAHDWLAQARHREFSSKWRVNRALRTLVGSPRGVALAAALAARWDAPVRYLIAVAGDVALATRARPWAAHDGAGAVDGDLDSRLDGSPDGRLDGRVDDAEAGSQPALGDRERRREEIEA